MASRTVPKPPHSSENGLFVEHMPPVELLSFNPGETLPRHMPSTLGYRTKRLPPDSLHGTRGSAYHETIELGDLEIDVVSMTVRVQGKVILTTVREFRLLEYLARHRGRVFTRDQLLDVVWKVGSFVTPRSIDVFVRRLCEKIERDPRHPRYLKTVRGIGYRFESERRSGPSPGPGFDHGR